MSRLREIVHTLVWVARHLLGRLRVPAADPLRAHIKTTDVLLDVGAHSGNWSVALSRLVPDGKVYAFEALPYYARVLAVTLRILGKTNVEVVGKPVLNERKSVQLVFRDTSGNRLTGLTHVKGSDESTSETITVDGITLDSFLPTLGSHVRFVKMDIEGAELLALKGATRLLDTCRPLLYLEIDETYCLRYGHAAKDVFGFLTMREYRSYVRTDASWVPVDAESYAGAGDVWFVPAEDEDAFIGEHASARAAGV